jgi:hypothetical protein
MIALKEHAHMEKHGRHFQLPKIMLTLWLNVLEKENAIVIQESANAMQIMMGWHARELFVQTIVRVVVCASHKKHSLLKLGQLMTPPGMPKSKLVASVTLVTEGQTAQERSAHQEKT